MRTFFSFFAKNHMFAGIFTVMLLLVGLNSLLSIKKDLLPDVSYPIITVTTSYPEASPEDVELNVTAKIESALKDVDGIQDYTSVSLENVSVVSVTLSDSLNQRQLDVAMQRIRDAVARIGTLPAQIEGAPVIERRSSGERPVIVAGIYSGTQPYEKLRFQAAQLERRLKKIAGVSRIDKSGYLAREVRVELSPEKVKSYQLDVNEVIAAVQKRNIMGTAGAMESFACTQDIVAMSQFASPSDIGDVIVRATLDGPLVRVKDLARVNVGFEEERVITKINGRKVIGFAIYKLDSADIVKTVRAVKREVEASANWLPNGYSVMLSNDYSRYVDTSYRVVMQNGIMGFVLVVLILSLFLNFRVSLWVALGIPVSIFAAITLLQTAGFSLNVISLSALILVIGIIVDDAIIISESIFSEFENGRPSLEAASEGVAKVFVPVLSSLLTTVLAFFPLLLIPGSFGKFLFVMPFVVIVSLAVSLVEALVALPSHVCKSLERGTRLRKKAFIGKAEKLYEALLARVLKRCGPVIALSVAVLCTLFFLSSRFLRFDSFPLETAESFDISLETKQGCGIKITAEQTQKIEQLLLSQPAGEIESFITTVGTGPSALPKQNYATITVNLVPLSIRKRNAVQITDALREQLAALGDIGRITFDIKGSGPSPSKPISFKVIGKDDAERKNAVDALVALLSETAGVTDLERDDIEGKGELALSFDYEKLARDGFDVADVLRELRIHYDGEVITRIQYADEEIKYRLSAPVSVGKDLNFLGDIYLTNKYGKILQLKEIATFTQGRGVDGYRHYDGERAVTVEAGIQKSISTVKRVNELVRQRFNELNTEQTWLLVRGEQQNSDTSMRSFGFTFLTALVGIYLLLSLQFRSFAMPLLVIAVIPFGVAGVLAAFLLHAQPMTFLATMGIVGLTGVIVNDSLVMVDRLLQVDYAALSVKQWIGAIAAGAASRFRAIVLTTVTTAAGVLPLAYGIGGKDYTNAPMALALGWGLVFGTIVSLFVLPAMFHAALQIRYAKK